MDRVILNQNGWKNPSAGNNYSPASFGYGEKSIQNEITNSIKTKVLAIGIFLFFFFENGSLGIIPEQYYIIYRSIRISDLILYALVLYSLLCIKEYKELFRSKSLIIVKIFLSYIIFEFIYSALNYKFNILEYFFRLKLLWTTFLVFPFLLLLKRNGLSFLIKLIFPAAIFSNILYILSAVTGTAHLPDIHIITQNLPGNYEVTRVYGGTFFGDILFLGYVYFWVTKKFKVNQLLPAILFVIPHIIALGRGTWAYIAFTVIVIILVNTIKDKRIKTFFKQLAVVIVLISALVYGFLEFFPNSDFYVKAIYARLLQGKDDVEYDEGTYGVRVVYDNEILLKVWEQNNKLVGIGMHPLWVYRAENRNEEIIYSALSDVVWSGVLAVYGIIGLSIAVFFQLYYIKMAIKLIKKSKYSDILTLMLIVLVTKMIFTSLMTYEFQLVSMGILGIGSIYSFLIANLVFCYEKQKNEPAEATVKKVEPKMYYSYGKYSYSLYKSYRQK